MQALPQEKLSIEAERRSILADLRSGDFTKQRLACEQLSVLAEDYFPTLLPVAIGLISDANHLNDRIRDRVITLADQRTETQQLIQSTVTLLNRMQDSEPLSRIPVEALNAERNRFREPLEGKLSNSKTVCLTQTDATVDQDELDLLRFIVRLEEPKSQGKLISAQHIAKQFWGSEFKLHPVSLELNKGEILGLVGVNASGKTTLLRILSGELQPSQGKLLYPAFEDSPRRRNWRTIKRRIAYVSQALPRWPGRLYDNLCYVASMNGHPLQDIETKLDLLLKRYDLDKFRNHSWDQISGGYKTRFEIIRALLSVPDILILDEPLAYLDIISQQTVLRQLRQLARSKARPMGIVITSQQLYQIEAIADRLIVLDGGNVLFSGTTRDLSQLIDDVVVEFSSTGDMKEIEHVLRSLPYFKSLLATETGYIAVFENLIQANASKKQVIDFNTVVKVLGQDCPGQLSYARDISHSCRLLFEPRMADLISNKKE